MPQQKSTERVTVKCVYCGRTIDGYFWTGKKEKIVNLGTGETIAVSGTYERKVGYLHVACKAGIDAVEQLEKGKNNA